MNYPQHLTDCDRYWYDLIQKCRASGKSDYQWLKENNIKSSTFYYHVKKLRQKACQLPESTKRTSLPEVQEVVPVLFGEQEISFLSGKTETTIPTDASTTAIRLQLQDICVEISNAASQKVIQNTLSALRSLC